MNKLFKRNHSQGFSDKDGYLIIIRVEGTYQVVLTYFENLPDLNEPGYDINHYVNCDVKGTFLQHWTDIVASGNPMDKDFKKSFSVLSKIKPAFIRCRKGVRELFSYIPDLTVQTTYGFPDGVPEFSPMYSMILTPDVEKLIVKDILMESVPGLVRIPEKGGVSYNWMTYELKDPEEEE